MPLELVHEGEYLSQSIQDEFKAFLAQHSAAAVEEILLEFEVGRHYSIDVDCLSLLSHNTVLVSLLLHRPERTLQLLDDAINDYQSDLLELFTADGRGFMMSLKPCVHARIHSLPRCHELCKPTISCIRNEDVGHLLCLTGTVTRAAAVRMLHAERKVECAKCGKLFKVKAELELRNQMKLPTECGNEQGARRCAGTRFNDVEDTEVCSDYQELRVQEQVAKLGIGSIPRSITVVLQDDLVDRAKPGDDVLITAVVVRRWKPVRADTRVDIELVLRANHVTVCNQLVGAALVTRNSVELFERFWARHDRGGHSRFRARDHILRAVCPDLHGLFILKLALLLTLVGGVTQTDASGQRVRGESHLLLIGDPGTGKSQALKFAAALSPRSVVTTGIGSTSAGLTVTATKDSTGEWSLDAGALVLADGGVCCIDEFETMREADRTTIHEAMEQQTLSVAKAGLVCKLRTKTTIIAATNPSKGRAIDDEFGLDASCGIASPLLSRFDVILLMRDDADPDLDAQIADFILERDDDVAAEGGRADADEPMLTLGTQGSRGGEEAVWDIQLLRTYLECARRRFEPTMSRGAEQVLTAYFESQRQAEMRVASRTTIRLIESLIRLSQAHARLMWRDTVHISDAVYAIVLIEASGSSRGNGPLDDAAESLSVCRTPIPEPDASELRALATVQRVCGWLGIPINPTVDESGDELPSPAAGPGPGSAQRGYGVGDEDGYGPPPAGAGAGQGGNGLQPDWVSPRAPPTSGLRAAVAGADPSHSQGGLDDLPFADVVEVGEVSAQLDGGTSDPWGF
jgi:DNA helicase MCM9